MLEAIRTVTHKIGKYAEITLNTCAYAGTGNVLKVQEMLRICAEHLTVILSLQFYRLYLPYLTINQSTLIHLYPKPRQPSSPTNIPLLLICHTKLLNHKLNVP